MTEEQLQSYTVDLSATQAETIRAVHQKIKALDPEVTSAVITGKWLNGLIGYNAPNGEFVYALGPRRSDKVTLHLMPYYSSRALQDQYGPSLQKFLTGKSCMEFKTFDELPEDAMEAILTGGSQRSAEARQAAITVRKSAR